MACKPGSVLASRSPFSDPEAMDDHSSGACVAAGFTRPTRRAGRKCPCRLAEACDSPPYSALLPVGFAVPPPLLEARWALTPPFHPCRPSRSWTGGLFSVALSLSLRSPAIGRHRISVEPGLSSSPAITRGSSGRPAIRTAGVLRLKGASGQALRRTAGARASLHQPRRPHIPAANGAGTP